MEDILLDKKCDACGANITLMGSCRVSEEPEDADTYLVERCLNCGQHPVIEIARLDNNQEGLNPAADE